MRPRELNYRTRHQRNAQIIRQWRVLLALDHRQWFTLQEIMDDMPRLDRHPRTIRRDLEALTEVFPIELREGRNEEGLPLYQWRLRRSLAKLLKK